MIITIDCDGVLADFLGAVLRELDGPYRREDVTEIHIEAALRLAPGTLAAIVSRPGFVEGLKPIEGAIAAVRELRHAGHRVVCVTSPWYTSPWWAYERHMWLTQHFGFVSRDIVQCQDKTLIDADVLVEDTARNAVAFVRREDRRAVLIDAPYNTAEPLPWLVTRATSLAAWVDGRTQHGGQEQLDALQIETEK